MDQRSGDDLAGPLHLDARAFITLHGRNLGKEKRHLLRDQVEKAQEDQQEASEQFKDVLTRIKTLYGFEGGALEDAYEKLKADYEESETRAGAVRKRIATVEEIAEDLFKEWEEELKEISDRGLRSKSAAIPESHEGALWPASQRHEKG